MVEAEEDVKATEAERKKEQDEIKEKDEEDAKVWEEAGSNKGKDWPENGNRDYLAAAYYAVDAKR